MDPSFTLQFMSDLHTEMLGTVPDIKAHADYLALCGDIGNVFDEEDLYECLIRQVSGKFRHVFVVLGNHEYYGHVMDDVHAKCVVLGERYPNVHFLDKSSYTIPGTVRILGCTLWSHVDNSVAHSMMNDYKLIRKKDGRRISPIDVRRLHEEHAKWLDKELEEGGALPTIILTHHAADMRMNGQYCGGPLETAFATDLPWLFRPPVKVWLCGHTHQNMTVHVNGIAHTANCKGYSDECLRFDPTKTFHLTPPDFFRT